LERSPVREDRGNFSTDKITDGVTVANARFTEAITDASWPFTDGSTDAITDRFPTF
jgi:hypothetical protein